MFEKDDFTLETRLDEATMDRLEEMLRTDDTERYIALGRFLAQA